MNEESLLDIKTNLGKIRCAIDRIATLRSDFTQQDHLAVTSLKSDLKKHQTNITAVQERVCAPEETQWCRLAWLKVKNFPGLIIYQVTQLHSSSCIRASQVTLYPNTMSQVEFYTLLLALCLLFYTSCAGIAAFYNFFPESSEAAISTISTISTATNFTNAIPRTEPCHVADVVHPKEISSIIAIGFLVLIITFVLLLLFLKFVILLPWSIYYSSWLLMYLFIKAPILEQTEEQQQE